MHAMRGGHGKGRQADDGAAWGRAAAAGADPGHERRLNLWPGESRDEPGQNGAEAFPRGSDVIGISAQQNPIVIPAQMTDPIRFTLDGTEVSAAPGETIWQVAERQGIEIPHLCWLPQPGYRPDGNCRACLAESEGERVLAASCVRKPSPSMQVQTASERARFSRKMVFELLGGDQPARAAAHDPASRFWQWADTLGVDDSRFPRHSPPAPDLSHPAMAAQLHACIQCNLCVRACREVQVNDVIGMAARGYHEKIIFDFDDPMANSTCGACVECVQACPTGALMPATLVDTNGVYANAPDREVDSVCPYCGVGCQLTYKIRDDRIVAVEGKDGPANHNRLCVKRRFGFDYAHHPDRLT